VPTKVIAFVTVEAGQEDAFLAAARTCAAASRAEPGVLHYDLWREEGGARRFVFNELYVDDAAVDSHMGSAHFAAFGAAMAGVVAGQPDIIRLHGADVAA